MSSRSKPGMQSKPTTSVLVARYKSGIFEDYVSSDAIRQNYLEMGGDAARSVRSIAELASSGDRSATAAFELFGHHLGNAIARFCDRFDPSIVLIGGKIARSWDRFSSTAKQQIRDSTEIECRTSTGQSVALLGAANLHTTEQSTRRIKRRKTSQL